MNINYLNHLLHILILYIKQHYEQKHKNDKYSFYSGAHLLEYKLCLIIQLEKGSIHCRLELYANMLKYILNVDSTSIICSVLLMIDIVF